MEKAVWSSVLGVVVGVLLTAFDLWFPLVAGAVCVAVGITSRRARPIAFGLGVGLCLGLFVYIALGLLQVQGSPSESGTGSAG
ncbi:hypothetical protein Intca_0318 [Intrasporangium calvum DSM 43043]|jgi:hypothetical protein|uniref:Uncharacterized protein n=1 Tax=Intrasporangium calvum (strain ATCC 23552 / DSM 43043 / JCM 3097 / NBRC 12989 / NCIMB 10167 / NRRL B-3866 / 7 KIP) TaxID=710696 RepID=E6S7H7_INTC7|nr:hypothetical protein Intca_0318 [Intrasporangium calvum DSM 43043]AXG12153.1 hypothetical protein DN585_00715 [Intrasporangium calvum]